jgi:hypothetical protein
MECLCSADRMSRNMQHVAALSGIAGRPALRQAVANGKRFGLVQAVTLRSLMSLGELLLLPSGGSASGTCSTEACRPTLA